MKILHVGAFDAAGAAWHYTEPLAAQGIESRTLIVQPTPVAQRMHYTQGTDPQILKDALDSVDLIFWHCAIWDFARTNWASSSKPVIRDVYEAPIGEIDMGEYFEPERSVIWLNGSTSLRQSADTYRERFRGYRRVATTPDLCEMFDAAFVPCYIDSEVDAGAYTKARDFNEKYLLAVHSPTDRAIKNTEELDAACAMLHESYEWRVLRPMDHRSCMANKADGHIHFDHMQGYAGVCSYEAAAMAQVNIVHMNETTKRYMDAWTGGDMPPWMNAHDLEGLISALRDLAENRGIAEKLALDNREWYQTAWNNEIKGRRFAEWLKTL